MYQQVICAAIEKIIARALAMNSRGTEQLVSLEQKTLTLSLAELGFVIKFTVSNEQVLVTSVVELGDTQHDLIADCQITTSFKTLIALKKDQQLTQLIKDDKLTLVGDIKIAQQFARIAETLDIDWRSEMAKHIGDIPTYQLEKLGKSLFNKLNFAAKQIQADASEFLVHEKRLVVTSSQLSAFNQQVDQVSQQSQLLAERIERLMTHIQSSTAKASCE